MLASKRGGVKVRTGLGKVGGPENAAKDSEKSKATQERSRVPTLTWGTGLFSTEYLGKEITRGTKKSMESLYNKEKRKRGFKSLQFPFGGCLWEGKKTIVKRPKERRKTQTKSTRQKMIRE